MKKIVTLCCSLLLTISVFAGTQPAWKTIPEEQAWSKGERVINVRTCNYFSMDAAALWSYLQDAPMEGSGQSALELNLPSAYGGTLRFAVVESPVMAAELAAKYPMIRTWSGKGIDDPTATVRFDITQWGFHAMIMSAKGTEFIDPVNLNTSEYYMSYRKSDAIRSSSAMRSCEFDPNDDWNKLRADEISRDVATAQNKVMTQRSIGSTLRTYRLALACTGEYAAFYGGTVPGTLSGMVTSVNRINQVYETELCIHLNLIPNNDTLIFLNSNTDPYTNSSGSAMLSQNQSTVTARIGPANYDIGHVFSTGGGGIAGLGVICLSSSKARGVTGSPSPVGDAFDIDYVAHEMGHQFGANHTFNGTTGGCAGNVNNSTAFEPGSGSTIMAYAGLCPGQDVQGNSDPFFHTASFDEIQNYVQLSSGNICPVTTPTGNTAPVINSTTSNYTIPLLTPFRLTGSASDPDGDPLTYCWEQYDLGPSGAPTTPTLNAPLFRSQDPSVDSIRLMPKLTSVLLGLTAAGYERLPTYARNMKFRLTVRDNRSGGGGVTYENVSTQLTVFNSVTPFQVTTANVAGVSFPALSQQLITWDVSGTDVAPINTATVNILLSTDGGQTFPTVLAAGVPNNGSATVTLPNSQTNQGRIMIEAVGNVYFDINNKNFIIGAPQSLYETGIAGESVNVYPNPAAEEFTWTMTGTYRGVVKVILSDLSGRVLMEADYRKNDILLQSAINSTALKSGMYMLSVVTGAGVSVTKILRR